MNCIDGRELELRRPLAPGSTWVCPMCSCLNIVVGPLSPFSGLGWCQSPECIDLRSVNLIAKSIEPRRFEDYPELLMRLWLPQYLGGFDLREPDA